MKTKPRELFSFSMKFVPAERRFFWVLFGEKSLLEGRCLDCGFATDVAKGLAGARANPAVGGARLELHDGNLAYAMYAFIWLKLPPPYLAVPTPEDKSFEAEGFREWARRCEAVPPSPPPSGGPPGEPATTRPTKDGTSATTALDGCSWRVAAVHGG